MRFVWSLPIVAIAVASCAPSGASLAKNAKPSDDAQVIDAAVRDFLKPADWKTGDYSPSKVLGLSQNWDSNQRSDFEMSIVNAVQFSQHSGIAVESHRYKALVSLTKANGETFVPPQVLPINELGLSSPVILDTESPKGGYFPTQTQVHTSKGETLFLNATGSFSPPGYSKDGRFACVVMWAAWRRTASSVAFILQREKSGWKVIDRGYAQIPGQVHETVASLERS